MLAKSQIRERRTGNAGLGSRFRSERRHLPAQKPNKSHRERARRCAGICYREVVRDPVLPDPERVRVLDPLGTGPGRRGRKSQSNSRRFLDRDGLIQRSTTACWSKPLISAGPTSGAPPPPRTSLQPTRSNQ